MGSLHWSKRDDGKRPRRRLEALPLNENGRRRSGARQDWLAAQGSPLDVHDFIGT
jgi:hypothetical protein